MKNILIILPIVIILFIGCIISIEDFKISKIRNKWIKLGVYLGLFYYFILFLLAILNKFEIINLFSIKPEYFLYILIYTLIAFILSYLLWYFKLWAGGDAKLFTLYVFLVPLAFYSNSYFKYFPQLNLLINIFIPIFLYLIIKMLIYPVQLAMNYLKNPALLKEYYKKYKEKNKEKFTKNKFKEYAVVCVSFLIIMIVFQILRSRVNELLAPSLGHLITPSYYLLSIAVFNPLRNLLKKQLVLASILIFIYFIVSFIFFRDVAYKDIHRVFAIQMLLMSSYFYIYKFGKSAGSFLYNSAEVKVVQIENIGPGLYINKEYIRKLMGDRTNLNKLRGELNSILDKEEKKEFDDIVKEKTDAVKKERMYYSIFMLFRGFGLNTLPNTIKQVYQLIKKRGQEKKIFEKIYPKLNNEQKKEFDNIINNTDDVKKFLKSISGKLTEEQAQKLKEMIQERNAEIKARGLQPINHIILHKTFSFAPFMLLGVIITLATKSSLIHLFYQYILRR
ncbi:hypothetical protein JW977_00550 [Candidatus Falkowbacteria bacterium]|nr:hypothetical protein [Candidatus Falkowbacteria bacterium]